MYILQHRLLYHSQRQHLHLAQLRFRTPGSFIPSLFPLSPTNSLRAPPWQLYDPQGRKVVTYKRDPCGLRKPNTPFPEGHLSITEDIARNLSALDAVLTSFFIFKTCRDVNFPWKKKQKKQDMEKPVEKTDEKQISQQGLGKKQDEQQQKPADASADASTDPTTQPAMDGRGDYVRLPSHQ